MIIIAASSVVCYTYPVLVGAPESDLTASDASGQWNGWNSQLEICYSLIMCFYGLWKMHWINKSTLFCFFYLNHKKVAWGKVPYLVTDIQKEEKRGKFNEILITCPLFTFIVFALIKRKREKKWNHQFLQQEKTLVRIHLTASQIILLGSEPVSWAQLTSVQNGLIQ